MLAPCEFKNLVTGLVTIPPQWKKERSLNEVGVQTSKLKVGTQEAQTTVSCFGACEVLEKGVGTERKAYQASLEGLHYVYNGVQHDEAKLAEFLENCKEELLTILLRSAKSSAFDRYVPNWSRKNTDLSILYTLTSSVAKEEHLQALKVAWNTNGTIVAVAYGRIDTSGWCYNKGYVCIWNLARPDLCENVPHYSLETGTYATAVVFHPTDPCMLAVGTYSGEVVVFPDVTESVPREFSSSEAEVTHMEPITVLQWVRNPQELRSDHRILLCSSGQSGLIIHWSPANKLAKPVAAYSVHSKRHLPIGVAALAYSSAHSDRGTPLPALDGMLIVGLENGEIGRGRTGLLPIDANGTAPCRVVPLDLDWLESHRGPIQSLCISPFFRHLLLTCSSDGSAHFYSDMERSPLLSLEPSAESKGYLYDGSFSPFRPAVAAIVSRSAYLHLYDLQKDRSRPSYTAEAGIDGAAVLTVAFNSTSADWLATGDAGGAVRIWRLPTDISQPTDLERAALRATQLVREGKSETLQSTAVYDLFGFSV